MGIFERAEQYKKELDEAVEQLDAVQKIVYEMYADYNMYAESGDTESCEILGKFIKKLNIATDNE